MPDRSSESPIDWPIASLTEAYRRGRLSPVEVADEVLARIDRLNPSLHAYLVRFDDLTRRQAREAEAAYRAGRALPLERRADLDQGHVPACRGGDDLRIGRAPPPPHATRQRGGSQAESRGRRVHRQDQHRRIRPVGDQRQPPRPGGRQSVGHDAHAGRLERRCGGFGRGRACQRRAGRRRRGVDPHSGIVHRVARVQADLRPLPRRRRPGGDVGFRVPGSVGMARGRCAGVAGRASRVAG